MQSILIVQAVIFYKVTTNTEFMNPEPLLLEEVEG